MLLQSVAILMTGVLDLLSVSRTEPKQMVERAPDHFGLSGWKTDSRCSTHMSHKAQYYHQVAATVRATWPGRTP